MTPIFIGIVKNNLGEVVHSHVSQYADDTFFVEIYEDGVPLIISEFRKFHHLETLINKEYPNLTTIEYSNSVDALWLMDMLIKNK